MRTTACSYALMLALACSAQSGITVKVCEADDAKLEAPPVNVIPLGNGSWLGLLWKTAVQASVGKVNNSFEYYLSSLDASSLTPTKAAKWEFNAPWGKAALEDLFLHQGKPYALITLQDKGSNRLSVNVAPIDPNSLACGTLMSILEDASATELPGGSDKEAQPLGLKAVQAANNELWIFCDPVTRTAGGGAASTTQAYFSAMRLDKDLRTVWGGKIDGVKNVRATILSTVPSGKETAFVFGGIGMKSDEADASLLRVFRYDGKATTELESKTLGAENTPLDIRTTTRPDGMIIVTGIYGRAKAGLSMGGSDSRGVYAGIFDPTSSSWVTFTTLPIINAKGKEVSDLAIIDVMASSSNDGSCFVMQKSNGSYGPLLSNVWPVHIDAKGVATIGPLWSYVHTGGLPSFDPRVIMCEGKATLLVYDMRDNEARRKEGKEAKDGVKVEFSGVSFDPSGTATQVFGTSNMEPGRQVALRDMFPVGDGLWVTTASKGPYGRVLATVSMKP